MLAKITSKNQITIPKAIMAQIPETQYFDLKLEDGVVILRPLVIEGTNLETVRKKIRDLGLKPDCVQGAVQ